MLFAPLDKSSDSLRKYSLIFSIIAVPELGRCLIKDVFVLLFGPIANFNEDM
jgi:hypothetical protein